MCVFLPSKAFVAVAAAAARYSDDRARATGANLARGVQCRDRERERAREKINIE